VNNKINNHFECESNFNEDYFEDNHSQFRETIKSQSTDIRSAIADIDNINLRLSPHMANG
jgi:hypothetical protein